MFSLHFAVNNMYYMITNYTHKKYFDIILDFFFLVNIRKYERWRVNKNISLLKSAEPLFKIIYISHDYLNDGFVRIRLNFMLWS